MGRYGTEQLREALATFVARHVSVCFTGEVIKNKDAEEKGLIEVRFNDMYFKAKIQAVSEKTDEGELIIPKVGSKVFCVSEGNSENMLVVVATTDIEKYRLRIDPMEIYIDEEEILINEGKPLGSIQITEEKIVFNQGKRRGLVKIEELEQNLGVVKQFVEKLNTVIPSALIAIGAGTASNGATGAANFRSAMSGLNIQFKDMENKDILQ